MLWRERTGAIIKKRRKDLLWTGELRNNLLER